jgi:FAD/FMN-containing dehydrogenase
VVADIVDVRTVNDIRLALFKAHLSKSHVSIAGRRHSMGGQTFEKNNIVLNMLPFNGMSYDNKSGLLTVQSGATWKDIQRYLDPKGRSVWVMQSDNIFTVGGTLSANAHGWQPRQAPIASTVENFQILLASGELKNCSRTENADLFHAALGGYGLFGVMLDVRLKTVPNKLYAQHSLFFPAKEYASRFKKHVTDNPSAELAYGRLSIDHENFLTEAGLHTFEVVEPQAAPLPPMEPESMVAFKNRIFRSSAKSDTGKKTRWLVEKRVSLYQEAHRVTRNTVMSPDFEVIGHPAGASHDILHEYFVPYSKMDDFVDDLRSGVRKYDLNLLNVTLRDVKKDDDAVLAYAKTDSCALVLFFSQPATPQAEETMRQFTSEIIDRALELNGSFYLPYRLHYSKEQFRKAYPRADEFMQIKNKYDPKGVFTSQFFRHNFP